MTFIIGMIVGAILVAAYFHDREQDEQAPRDEFDDNPDILPSKKPTDKVKKGGR